MLMDAKTNFHGTPIGNLEVSWENPVFPHDDNGADNFLYLDGHVERIKALDPDGALPTETTDAYRNANDYFVQNIQIWY